MDFEIKCKKCGSLDVSIYGGYCETCREPFYSLECGKCGNEFDSHIAEPHRMAKRLIRKVVSFSTASLTLVPLFSFSSIFHWSAGDQFIGGCLAGVPIAASLFLWSDSLWDALRLVRV